VQLVQRGDAHSHADDGLNAHGATGAAEHHRAIQGAVVGQRQAGQAVGCRGLYQRLDGSRAAEEGEVGMDVEMAHRDDSTTS
jgi:hypothetical protein